MIDTATFAKPATDTFAPTAAEKQSWEQNGFFVREGVFSPAECEKLSAAAERLAFDESVPAGRRKLNALSLERGDEKPIMHSATRPDIYDALFRDHVRDPRLTDAVAGILGPDLLTHNNLFLFKAPGVGLPFPWHQDMWFFGKSYRTSTTVGAWQAMDDATIENGCMWVIPGSHRLPLLEHDLPTDGPQQGEFRCARVSADDEAKAISVAMPRGAVLFFHGFLLHKSGHNHTTQPRRTYVTHFLRADAENVNPNYVGWPLHLVRGEAHHGENIVQPEPENSLAAVDRQWWEDAEKRTANGLSRV